MMFHFYKQSETVRMLIIAIIGVVLGLITYEIIYYLNPFSLRATTSWIVAFLIGIARQHALHRHFTFLYKTPYFKSLYRAYIVDFGALLVSTLLNGFLIEILHFHHRLAWVCCLLSSALLSLLFLKKYIFKTSANLE